MGTGVMSANFGLVLLESSIQVIGNPRINSTVNYEMPQSDFSTAMTKTLTFYDSLFLILVKQK